MACVLKALTKVNALRKYFLIKSPPVISSADVGNKKYTWMWRHRLKKCPSKIALFTFELN